MISIYKKDVAFDLPVQSKEAGDIGIAQTSQGMEHGWWHLRMNPSGFVTSG